MKRYFQLVNFEFNRFAKIFVVLLGIAIVVEFAGIIIMARSYMSSVNEAIFRGGLPKSEVLNNFGTFSLTHVMGSSWFLFPIAVCIAAVGIYIFLIWYRDWFGKNTFIYRLLMLPTTRLNIFFAKATAILLATLGFVAAQLSLFPLQSMVVRSLVPVDFRTDLTVQTLINSFLELHFIYPTTFIEFIFHYGIGIIAVMVLFTGILLERSFRWKGVILGIGYGVLAVMFFLSPVMLQEMVLNDYLYKGELLILEIVTALIIMASSIWISGYLLRKKIRV